MNVIKRNGSEVKFNKKKIISAITKAMKSCNVSDPDFVMQIADSIEGRNQKVITVEDIQDLIENKLMASKYKNVAQQYIRYRYERERIRHSNTTDDAILSLIEQDNELLKQENSNKNPTIISTQRDYMAGEVSKDLTNRIFLPQDIVEAHKKGLIHFHDADYFAQHCHAFDLVNLEDMLQNGTVINGTLVEKPHSFSTACNIATQIMAQVASSQYGGQSISLTHLAPFVNVSREKIRQEIDDEWANIPETSEIKEHKKEIVENRVRKEIEKGVQTMQYQINTLMTTNGQSPFVTLFMYLNETDDPQIKEDLALIIEEVVKQRYVGTKNEKGVYVTPAFPKLIYVLEEDNIHKNSKYYYLTELCAKCTARRLVPDYISEKVMKQLKQDEDGNGYCYPVMGCRSALTVWRDKDKKAKFYGRFNQGVVTVNLVDIGLSAHKDMDEFWKIFDERMELCHRALRCRHERLKGTISDVAPVLWQYGALTRLQKGEVIDEYLYGGYSTLSLGYAGLWECVYSLIGKKLTEPEGEELGLQIMKKLNEYTNKWKKEENIAYSLYGTPLESTTYKFAQCLQKRFGIMEGVTDKDYITNSYHVHVTEPIDAFSKLKLEAKFQALSPGGAISYVEVPNMENNIYAVLTIINFIYDNIMYAELNTKSDYCQVCGYNGEIEIVEDENEKLIWQCPNCGNTDQNKMNVARRTCGYIGTQFWNQGRTDEILHRYVHLDDHEYKGCDI